MPITDLIICQFGEETTWGSCETATRRMMGVTGCSLKIDDTVHHTEEMGMLNPSELIAEVEFKGSGNIAADLSYEDIIIPLDNIFDEETAVGTADPYTWTYTAPLLAAVVPNLYTLEYGATNAEYEACGVLFTGFTIAGEAGGVWTGDFPFICKDIDDDSMAALNVRTVELIRMADTVLSVDAWDGTMGNTNVDATLISFELTLDTGRHTKTFAGDVQPLDWGETQWSGQLRTVLEFNASGKAIVDELLTPVLVQRQIEIEATSGAHIATIQFCGTLIDGAELFTDRDGNITVDLLWDGTYNPTFTGWLTITVLNAIAAIL